MYASFVNGSSKEDIVKKFNEIVEEFGKPKGNIILVENLINEILINFGHHNELYIIYQDNEFKLISQLGLFWIRHFDYVFVGCVKAKEWCTTEQLNLLHDLCYNCYRNRR